MQIKISAPAVISTSIQLPASKSISNRALIIHALAQGTCTPQNLSDCDDTQVMIRALASSNETVDIMAAGTAMRFLTAFFAVSKGTKVITGTERMRMRPIALLTNALKELGAQIEYIENEGFPPLRIKGTKLSGKEISLRGNVSSQYISALLMIGPVLKNGLSIHLIGEIISKPYIHLTLKLMKDFGANIRWTGACIHIEPQPYQAVSFTVESDWSAASYWYQVVALSANASVELKGLFKNSYQGDSRVAELFISLGVETTFTPNGVLITRTGNCCKQLEYDFIHEPDLAQTVVVTCALMNIPFHFRGLQSLKIKETDRMAALIAELSKLGYLLHEANGSELFWSGERGEVLPHPSIKTYEDHRMAMAFAPVCLRFNSILIEEPQVVSKSYPRYWDDLRKAGFIIKEV